MSFSKKSVSEAKEIISARRDTAKAEFYNRQIEVSSKIPEIAPIIRDISATGFKIVSAAFDHTLKPGFVDSIREECKSLRMAEEALLVKHGYPADYLNAKYTCSLCSDTGYMGINMCECLKREIVRLEAENSGLGVLLKKQSFDNFDMSYYSTEKQRIESNFSRLKTFAESFSGAEKSSWLLMGPTGLGKTHLSTAVAGTLINRGYSVVYESAQGILHTFEARRFENDLSVNPMERFGDCDLLIIDDLGTEVTNQFTLSCVYTVINERLISGKPMIINTNLTQTELRERYTDRLASRIFGEFNVLLFVGDDIRRQKILKANKK